MVSRRDNQSSVLLEIGVLKYETTVCAAVVPQFLVRDQW